MWGWRGVADAAVVEERLIDVVTKRGFLLLGAHEQASATAEVQIVADSGGFAVVRSHLAPGLEVASELSSALKVSACFAEVEVRDQEVDATACELDATGTAGAGEDHDEEAGELCEEWFEGGKYRSE